MNDSILLSIKKLLGCEEDYDVFDQDIIMAINSALMVLNQIGVGPSSGFFITSEAETWSDFIGSAINIEGVKTYVYLKARLVFDPPTSSSLEASIKEQIKELEWRLNVMVDPPLN